MPAIKHKPRKRVRENEVLPGYSFLLQRNIKTQQDIVQDKAQLQESLREAVVGKEYNFCYRLLLTSFSSQFRFAPSRFPCSRESAARS